MGPVLAAAFAMCALTANAPAVYLSDAAAASASAPAPVFGLQLLHKGGVIRVNRTTALAVGIQNLTATPRTALRVCLNLPRTVRVRSVRQGKVSTAGICWSVPRVGGHEFKFLEFTAEPLKTAAHLIRVLATLKSAEIKQPSKVTVAIVISRR